MLSPCKYPMRPGKDLDLDWGEESSMAKTIAGRQTREGKYACPTQVSPGVASEDHRDVAGSHKEDTGILPGPEAKGAQAGSLELPGRRVRGVQLFLSASDQGGVAHGLQRGDGLGHEGGLLFDDGIVDGSAEAFVEDFHAEQFGRGAGPVLVG